jgi:hypothetical protein
MLPKWCLFSKCGYSQYGEGTGVPAFTYFKDHKAIVDFCDYQLRAYTDEPR